MLTVSDKLNFSDEWKDFIKQPESINFLIKKLEIINKKRKKNNIQELLLANFFDYASDHFISVNDMILWLNSGDYVKLSKTIANTIENREMILKILNGVRKDLGLEKLSFHKLPNHIAKYYNEECSLLLSNRNKIKDIEKQFVKIKNKKNIKTTEKSGFVYIVSSNSFKNYFKIGSTIDLKSRLVSYNTCTPFGDFSYEYKKFVNDRVYVEKIIHKKFNYCRKNGEWFKENINKIIQEIEKFT